MSRLAKIVGDEIVFAKYGPKVSYGDRTLFSPTEQTWRDLGFAEVPTANPEEGYHDEYSISTRTETRNLVVGAERVERQVKTGEDEKGNPVYGTVSELQPVYGEQEVEVPYIVATAVKDPDPLPEPEPPPPPPKTYSKLKLINACKERDIWTQVKQEIESLGKTDEFIAAQELRSDYPGFDQIVAFFKDEFPSVDVDGILAEAEA